MVMRNPEKVKLNFFAVIESLYINQVTVDMQSSRLMY